MHPLDPSGSFQEKKVDLQSPPFWVISTIAKTDTQADRKTGSAQLKAHFDEKIVGFQAELIDKHSN